MLHWQSQGCQFFEFMKCKVFKIHLQNEFDELAVNKFLADFELKQVFASVVNEKEPFWSILAFYEDEIPKVKPFNSTELIAQSFDRTPEIQSPVSPVSEPKQPEKAAPDPIILTPEQENDFNNLKKWRNERAARDGRAPYMIAHNDSLMQIAALPVKTKEDLLQIKGFGEKRAEKYADEILRVLDLSASEEQ